MRKAAWVLRGCADAGRSAAHGRWTRGQPSVAVAGCLGLERLSQSADGSRFVTCGAIGARILILDLLSTGSLSSLSTRALLRAGAAFGIEPTAIRTALTRLKAEGRLAQAGRGHYAIGSRGEPLQQRILGWRRVLARRRPWRGDWLLAVAGPQERADRTVWRRTLRALGLEGFAEAETNVWVRPDNLAGGVQGMRQRLGELEAAPSLLMIQARGLDEHRQARFRRLWRARALQQEHARLARQLERSAAGLEGKTQAAAAAETLTLGRRAVREIMRDPLLPDELCSPEALSRLIEAMLRYDRLGKRVWRGYLAE